MVLKLRVEHSYCQGMFESSVNSDGTQTNHLQSINTSQFESSVNSDGTQTRFTRISKGIRFESSVNSDGTQTE